jgi:hypothetical protein
MFSVIKKKMFIHYYVFLKRSLRCFLYTIPKVSTEIPRRFDFKHIRDIQCDTPQDAWKPRDIMCTN